MGLVALEGGELASLEDKCAVQGFYSGGYVGRGVSGKVASPDGPWVVLVVWFCEYVSVSAFQTGEEACSGWKSGGLTA